MPNKWLKIRTLLYRLVVGLKGNKVDRGAGGCRQTQEKPQPRQNYAWAGVLIMCKACAVSNITFPENPSIAGLSRPHRDHSEANKANLVTYVHLTGNHASVTPIGPLSLTFGDAGSTNPHNKQVTRIRTLKTCICGPPPCALPWRRNL